MVSKNTNRNQVLSKTDRLVHYMIIFALVIIYLLGCIYIYTFTVDDTFISLRYAKNLADHGVLAFNPNDQPVEGYTNFLLVLIEAFFIKLGVQRAVHIPKIVGIISGILAIWTTYKISTKVIKPDIKFLNLLPCLALAVSTPFIAWTTGGLETVLFTLLLLVGVYYFILSIETNDFLHCFLSDLFYLLATLCRPEGIIFWSAGYLYIFLNDKKPGLKKRFKSMVLFLTIFIAFLSWKYYYFGNILPISFYAKVNLNSFQTTVFGGLTKFLMFLIVNLNIIYFLAFTYSIRISILEKVESIKYMIWLFTVFSAYLISLGPTTFMDQVFRLHVPILPLLFIVGSYGIYQLLNNSSLKYRWKFGFIAMLCILQLGIGSYKLHNIWVYDYGWADQAVGMSQLKSQFVSEAEAKWLAATLPAGSSIAVGDIGAMGFYSDLYIIDTWSIINKDLVRLKREQSKLNLNSDQYIAISRKMAAYVFDKNPEVIYFQYIDYSLDPRSKDYVLVKNPFYEEGIFVRRDLMSGDITKFTTLDQFRGSLH